MAIRYVGLLIILRSCWHILDLREWSQLLKPADKTLRISLVVALVLQPLIRRIDVLNDFNVSRLLQIIHMHAVPVVENLLATLIDFIISTGQCTLCFCQHLR